MPWKEAQAWEREVKSPVTLSKSLPSLGQSCLSGTPEGSGGQWWRVKPGVLTPGCSVMLLYNLGQSS